jgi:hypothetical protein
MGNRQSQQDVDYFLPGDSMESPILTRHINMDDDWIDDQYAQVQRKQMLHEELNSLNNMVRFSGKAIEFQLPYLF